MTDAIAIALPIVTILAWAGPTLFGWVAPFLERRQAEARRDLMVALDHPRRAQVEPFDPSRPPPSCHVSDGALGWGVGHIAVMVDGVPTPLVSGYDCDAGKATVWAIGPNGVPLVDFVTERPVTRVVRGRIEARWMTPDGQPPESHRPKPLNFQ